MKFIIQVLFISIIILSSNQAYSFECNQEPIPKRLTISQFKEMDRILDERLKLTQEQKRYIRENRPQHRKKIEEIVNKMKTEQMIIRNIHLSGVPLYQEMIQTAPHKAQLVILNQNLQKQKEENRKNFEKILTEEQKIELNKMKAEHKR